MSNVKTSQAVTKINLSGRGPDKAGKVRDLFDLGNQLLLVASDRISAFDVILGSPIPGKGKILNQISLFWFDFIKDIIPNHIISSNPAAFPEPFNQHAAILGKRSMLVKKTKVIPIEGVVRGYLSGSGWKEYKKSQSICGIKLPAGLKESSKLPEPVFTPTTKAESGHDLPITQAAVEKQLGKTVADKIKNTAIAIYKKAAAFALTKGIIIADTKFEFGQTLDGQIILIDEALTPDSSRFWPQALYKAGQSQPSYDKQFVRDYLKEIKWNKEPPAPGLPEEIIKQTYDKYFEAFSKLTGRSDL